MFLPGFPAVRVPEWFAPESCFAAPPGRPVKAATPCGAPRFGGWGGMRTGAASSGKTGLEPAQDALKALRVHLFVREEKSPAQAVRGQRN